MEELGLYESCVEPDPEEKLRIEPHGKQEDPAMKTKLDFQKISACNFEDTRGEVKQTSQAQLLIKFDKAKGRARFS